MHLEFDEFQSVNVTFMVRRSRREVSKSIEALLLLYVRGSERCRITSDVRSWPPSYGSPFGGFPFDRSDETAANPYG